MLVCIAFKFVKYYTCFHFRKKEKWIPNVDNAKSNQKQKAKSNQTRKRKQKQKIKGKKK